MKKIYYIAIIVLGLLFGFTSLKLSEYYARDHLYQQQLNGYEKNKIYYHMFLEDWIFSTHSDQFHFGRDESIDQQVTTIEGVKKLYPFIALPFSNYGANGISQYSEINLVIEDSPIQKELDKELGLYIMPYYPEDNIDSTMEKCFVSSSLYETLKRELNVDCLNKKMTINNIRIPVEQSIGNEVYFGMEEKEQVVAYPYCVEFSQSNMTVNISGIHEVFGFSRIYGSRNVILVPYQYLEKYYEFSGTNVVFTDSLDASRVVLDNMKALDNRIAAECPSIEDDKEYSYFLEAKRPGMLGSLILLVLGMFGTLILMAKMKDSLEKRKIGWLGVVFAISTLYVVINLFCLSQYKYYNMTLKQSMFTNAIFINLAVVVILHIGNLVIKKFASKGYER